MFTQNLLESTLIILHKTDGDECHLDFGKNLRNRNAVLKNFAQRVWIALKIINDIPSFVYWNRASIVLFCSLTGGDLPFVHVDQRNHYCRKNQFLTFSFHFNFNCEQATVKWQSQCALDFITSTLKILQTECINIQHNL